MKRLTVVALALFLVTTVSATTSYDGPTDQPHIMGDVEDKIEEDIREEVNEKLENETADVEVEVKDNSKGFMQAIVGFFDSLL